MTRAPLQALEFHAEELSRYPDAVLRVVRGELSALIVRGVYTGEVIERVVQRMQRGEFALPPLLRESRDPNVLQSLSYGLPVSPSDIFPQGPDVDEYFLTVPRFHAACASVFEPDPPVTARLHQVLEALAGGLPTGPARTPDGRPYCGVNIRAFAPSLGLGPHCENEFTGTLPVFNPIRDRVSVETQMPYYLQASRAEQGGRLILYDAFWEPDQEAPHDAMRNERDHTRIAELPHIVVELAAGDMVLFDGASRYHQVDQVLGARTRWTMGGFAALTRDATQLVYWS